MDEAKEKIDGIDTLKAGDITPVLGKRAQTVLEQLIRDFYKMEFWDRIKGDALDAIDE